METKSISYYAGFACGFLAVFIVAFLIRLIIVKVLKKKIEPNNYDERQIAARGQAFKVGFMSFCIWHIFYMIFDATCGSLFMMPAMWSLTGLLVCATTFVIACIWKDAYFALNTKRNHFYFFLVAVTILNFIFFLINGGFEKKIEGTMYIGTQYVNLFVAIMLIIISLNLFAKQIAEKKAEKNMEE